MDDNEMGRLKKIETFSTVDELAERLKVHKSWIYGQTRKTGPGSIPRIRIGKYLRFSWPEVCEWLMRQQNEDKR